jgi:uncharacterized protein (TIRG00374 family)
VTQTPSEDAGAAAADSEEPSAPSASFNRRRSVIGGVIAVAFLIIVFARVIPQVGDYQGAIDALGQLSATDIATLAAALLTYLAFYGLPYLVATPGINFVQSEIVNNSRFTIGNGIPGGGALGLAVGYAQLTFYRATPTAATAAIGATGVWASFVTLALPITGVAALAIAGEDVSAFLVPALVGLAILVALVIAFALILRSERNAVRIGAFADRVVGAVVRRFRPQTEVHLSESVLHLRHDIVGLVSRRWLAITAATFSVSLGQFLILFVALSLVSTSSEFALLAAYGCWAISQLGILIPATPGGLGTVDAALIALLTTIGVSDGDATAAALLWRATYYFPQILLGLVCIFIWRVQVRREQRTG